MQNDNISISGIKGMLHNFKTTFQGDLLSMQEIRQTISEDQKTKSDFIGLLEKHHDFLEESIAVLTDKEASSAEKQVHLTRFIHLLFMHGKAEEETLYQSLKHAEEKEARLEGIAGQDEHDVAFQMAKELKAMDFEVSWSEEIDAKAKVLASLVQNHINEEETEMFTIAENAIAPIKMDVISGFYLEKCKVYLDEEILGI